MNIQPIALSALRISPHNARKTGGTNVADLVASIGAHGLMQNLTVTPANDGIYEVVAGGRRLRALQQMLEAGTLPEGLDQVPCQIITNGEVIEASTAENSIRENMHPADQCEAFQAMVAAKKPIADIAAHFNVTELVVEQRLKLAKVSPKIIAEYREGKATLGQMQVLALSNDIKQQEKLWFGAQHDYERREDRLRQAITKAEVPSSDQRVRLVGYENYVARGGAIRRDLFDPNNGGFVCNTKLLDEMVVEKLEQAAASIAGDGWAWIETHASLDYNQEYKYGRVSGNARTRKETPEEKARLGVIEARIKDLSKQIDALEQANDFDFGDPLHEALSDEVDALDSEREQIKKGLTEWPAAVKEKSGVLIYLGDRGLTIDHGRLKPGQKSVKAKTGKDGKVTAAPKKAELSDNMVRRLTAHKTAALQLKVAQDPLTALRLIVECLISQLYFKSSSSALKITPNNSTADLEMHIRAGATELATAPARVALKALIDAWYKRGLPTQVGALRAWIFKQDQPVLLELLALATATTIDAVHGSNSRKPAADTIAQDVKLNMADFWQPSPAAFLSHVQKALAIEAVTEACGKTEGVALESLKRDAVIAEAAKKLHGTGWLPKPLRGPGYALKKPAASTSTAAAPPATKAPAEKSKPAAKKAAPAKKKPVKKAIRKAARK